MLQMEFGLDGSGLTYDRLHELTNMALKRLKPWKHPIYGNHKF